MFEQKGHIPNLFDLPPFNCKYLTKLLMCLFKPNQRDQIRNNSNYLFTIGGRIQTSR